MQRPLNCLFCASLVIARAGELQMDLLCAKGDTADECDLKDHRLSGMFTSAVAVVKHQGTALDARLSSLLLTMV